MRSQALIAIPPREMDSAQSVIRAAFAHALEACGGRERADGIAKRLFSRDRLAQSIVERAAVDPGMTDGWGSALVGEAVADFLGSLAPHSAISTIMGRGVTVIFDGLGRISLPTRSGSPVAAASGVGEGEPIPVRASTLINVNLDPGKLGCISALSRETVKRSKGQQVVEAILREDAGASLDAAYLSTTAAGALPAGLLYGVTPVVPDVDEGTAAMINDIANVASAAATGGSGDVVLIAAPARAIKIKVRAPDIALPILPSIAVPADRLIAVDASALAHGFGSMPDISASEHAVIHMSDTPLPISTPGSPATVADPVRSMWQTDGVAIRMLLDLSFGKRSATSAQYIDSIENW